MSHSFRIENTPATLDSHLYADGMIRPRYVTGVATPRAIGNYPVVGPEGNIQLPPNAIISRIMLGGNIVGAGATMQVNTAATSGGVLGSAIGSVTTLVDVNARNVEILASPLLTLTTGFAGNTWLSVNSLVAAVTSGSINVTVEFF